MTRINPHLGWFAAVDQVPLIHDQTLHLIAQGKDGLEAAEARRVRADAPRSTRSSLKNPPTPATMGHPPIP